MVANNLNSQYRHYYTYLEPILADPVVRSYFGLIASFLLVTFLIFFALSPTINTILSLQKRIEDQKTTIAALTQKANDLIKANEAYGQVENLIPLLNEALPNQPFPQKVISDVNLVASQSSVILSGPQFQTIDINTDTKSKDQASPSGAVKMGFTLSITGTKEDVRTFLSKLESSLRYIRVEGLMVSDSKKPGLMNMDISAANFYLPNK